MFNWAWSVKPDSAVCDIMQCMEDFSMHAWEQIQLTVDHIEDHLAEELRIENLARLAGLSQFYYQRLFSRLVRKPVNEYIRLRRLAMASERLSGSGKRILDIALETGFLSHETFTRAFKEAFGLTPEQYRAAPVYLNQFNKPQLLFGYTLADENVPLVADGMVLEVVRKRLEAPRRFTGLVLEEPIQQIPGGDETGIDHMGLLWDEFHKDKPSIPGIRQDSVEMGVAFPGSAEGRYRYFAGAEAYADAPEGYETWALAAGEYIVCSFEAEDFTHLVMDALYKAKRYLFETWLPNHNIQVEPFEAEIYEKHSPETTVMEVWVKPLA